MTETFRGKDTEYEVQYRVLPGENWTELQTEETIEKARKTIEEKKEWMKHSSLQLAYQIVRIDTETVRMIVE